MCKCGHVSKMHRLHMWVYMHMHVYEKMGIHNPEYVSRYIVMNLCMYTAIFIYICVHLHPFSMWGHICAKCVNMCMRWVCIFVFTCKWTICKMCICDFLWICTWLYVRVSLYVNIFAHCISVNISIHTWECVYLDWILWKQDWGQFCRACPGPSSRG